MALSACIQDPDGAIGEPLQHGGCAAHATLHPQKMLEWLVAEVGCELSGDLWVVLAVASSGLCFHVFMFQKVLLGALCSVKDMQHAHAPPGRLRRPRVWGCLGILWGCSGMCMATWQPCQHKAAHLIVVVVAVKQDRLQQRQPRRVGNDGGAQHVAHVRTAGQRRAAGQHKCQDPTLQQSRLSKVEPAG